MTGTTHDTATSSNWDEYEREKKRIIALNLSAEQYENEIKQLTQRLDL